MKTLSQENKGKVIDALTDIAAKAQAYAEAVMLDKGTLCMLDGGMRDVIALAQYVSSKCYQPERKRELVGRNMVEVAP